MVENLQHTICALCFVPLRLVNFFVIELSPECKQFSLDQEPLYLMSFKMWVIKMSVRRNSLGYKVIRQTFCIFIYYFHLLGQIDTYMQVALICSTLGYQMSHYQVGKQISSSGAKATLGNRSQKISSQRAISSFSSSVIVM